TIGLRQGVNVVGRHQRSASGHILHNHFRVAAYVSRHVAGQQPRPIVVTSARTRSYDNPDGLSGKKTVLRADRSAAEKRDAKTREKDSANCHRSSVLLWLMSCFGHVGDHSALHQLVG